MLEKSPCRQEASSGCCDERTRIGMDERSRVAPPSWSGLAVAMFFHRRLALSMNTQRSSKVSSLGIR